MTCDACQAQMAELLGLPAAEAPGPELSRHLESCSDCRRGWEDARRGFEALGTLPALTAPPAAVERVRAVVTAGLGVEVRPTALRRSALPPETVMATGFGMMAALASTLILGARVDLDAHPPLVIAGGAILWTGAFIAAFWLILRRGAEARSTRDLALCGVGAMAAFMVIDQLLPLTHVVHYCQVDSWARRVLGPVGVKGLFFVVGSGYAMLPIFFLSLATGRRYRNGHLRGALLSGGLFFFLLAPAIFLQCRSFTLGALASWLAGSVIGAFAGSAAGYWLNRRAFGVRPATA